MPAQGTPKARRYEDRCRERLALLDKAAAEVVSVCSGIPEVRAVYVYGSYARGSIGPTSDLDVLIVRETDLSRWSREDDIRLRLRTPVGFDLLVVRPDEFAQAMPANSMGRTILSEARLIYAA